MVENGSQDDSASCGTSSDATKRLEVERTSTVGRWGTATVLKGIDLENNVDYKHGDYYLKHSLIIKP